MPTRFPRNPAAAQTGSKRKDFYTVAELAIRWNLSERHIRRLIANDHDPRSHLRTAMEREDRNRDRLRQMRQDHKEAEAGITRLLELVEKGLMDAEDASLRERLVNLRFRRDELAEAISDLSRRLAMAEPVITPEKIEQIAILLREKLHRGSPDLRQAYARLLLSEVRVNDREIRISGSKAVLARSASAGVGNTTPAVLSFVREWRARQDSNLLPQD
jgi:site-specific DNA recombinase